LCLRSEHLGRFHYSDMYIRIRACPFVFLGDAMDTTGTFGDTYISFVPDLNGKFK